MSYRVHPQEMNNVLKLSAPERYSYFIGKVTDWEEVWSIGNNEGWALLADDSGHECLPVWPAEAYAQACCEGNWGGNKPRMIPLATWLEKWLPGMVKDGRRVAVFPTPTDKTTGKGIIIEPQGLLNDLKEILTDNYGEGEEESE